MQAGFQLCNPGVIGAKEHKIVKDSPSQVIIHKTAWCPVLEACKQLGLSTREICPNFIVQRYLGMLKTLNPQLSLKIGKIRPEDPYCEYIIELVEE